MTASLLMDDYRDTEGIKWTPMIVLSILVHLFFFVVVLILPDAMPSRRIQGMPYYEVDLVEMPGSGGEQARVSDEGIVAESPSGKNVALTASPAQRIQEVTSESKPLVIAKRTSKKRLIESKTSKVSSAKLIDKAISRIEKALKTDNSNHLDKALSKLQKGSQGDNKGASQPGGAGGSVSGLPMRIYQMEVENRIKGNWAYPVVADDKKLLEALVIIRVKRDGTILNSKYKKLSSDSVFDQSVIKAIERSNPLPPFPDGYRRSYDDIEINFNLKDFL